MSTIILNIPYKAEEFFRKTVKEIIGTGKGKLGKAATEALVHWAKDKQQDEIAKRMIKRLKKGYHMGKLTIKNRDEIHDRY